jgi:hypothetical protein
MMPQRKSTKGGYLSIINSNRDQLAAIKAGESRIHAILGGHDSSRVDRLQ